MRAPPAAPSALWVVHADGSHTLLGHYRDGSWSPHARFVVATAGRRLAALDPKDGKVHWSLTAAAPVRGARWSPSRRCRPAAGSRTSREERSGSSPATDRETTSGARRRRRAARLASPRSSAGARVRRSRRGGTARLGRDGRAPRVALPPRLPAHAARVVVRRPAPARDEPGAPRRARAHLRPLGPVERPARADGSFGSAAFAPGSHDVLVLRRLGPAARARVELLRPGRAPRPLETLVGGLAGLAPAPDGRTVLVGWGAADQWLLVPTLEGGRARRVTGLTATFGAPAIPVAGAWAP